MLGFKDGLLPYLYVALAFGLALAFYKLHSKNRQVVGDSWETVKSSYKEARDKIKGKDGDKIKEYVEKKTYHVFWLLVAGAVLALGFGLFFLNTLTLALISTPFFWATLLGFIFSVVLIKKTAGVSRFVAFLIVLAIVSIIGAVAWRDYAAEPLKEATFAISHWFSSWFSAEDTAEKPRRGDPGLAITLAPGKISVIPVLKGKGLRWAVQGCIAIKVDNNTPKSMCGPGFEPDKKFWPFPGEMPEPVSDYYWQNGAVWQVSALQEKPMVFGYNFVDLNR